MQIRATLTRVFFSIIFFFVIIIFLCLSILQTAYLSILVAYRLLEVYGRETADLGG